eukprot:6473460-Amphidinium_carterae.1
MMQRRLQQIAQSKLIEDYFNRARTIESKANNRECAERRLFTELINSDVLQNVHQFQTPEWRNEHVPADVDFSTVDNWHHPQLHVASDPLRDVTKRRDWYSGDANSFGRPFIEARLAIYAREENKWDEVAQRGMYASLLRCPAGSLIIKRKGQLQWRVVLMELWGQVLTWPAVVEREVPVANTTFLNLDVGKLARPAWLVVTNPDTIEAWEAEWLGPLELHCVEPVHFKGHTTPGIRALTRGKPRSLWEVSARAGFWQLPYTALKWLADARKVERADTTEVSLLEALVKSACPDLSDDDVMECVGRRLPVPNEHDEMLKMSFIDECMHEADAPELEQERKKLRTKESNNLEFAKLFQIRRHEIRNPTSKKRKRYPESDTKQKQWPSGELTKQEAQACLPPGWQCSSEPNQNRWQLWETKTRKTITRSWLAYGRAGAFRLAAQAAWAYHVVKEGKESKDCPWSDLLEQDDAQEGKASSSH